ncbi:MAG: nicotinate-nucleotide adenylyltransferase [Nitrospirota bacterium]|jgi:nicotinate-nucleotide adenylyltransferase
MRLGVLGGTFNPIHFGHLRAAEEVRERLDMEKVLFIPAGNPPLKSADLAEAEARYRMTLIATAPNGAFDVSDIEVRTPRTSYTVETARELGRLYPGADILFILGLDAFLDLPEWKEPEELVGAMDFVVIGRPPRRFGELAESPFLDIAAGALEALDRGEAVSGKGRLTGGRTAHLLRVSLLDISSTDIREAVRAGRSIKYLLPRDVEFFIMSTGLYAG